MNPLIKWPGGKSGEIKNFEQYIPQFSRYIEPFFGGGALFFHLMPKRAIINDISSPLMDFYGLVKNQDKLLHRLLCCYNESFCNLMNVCSNYYSSIYDLFASYNNHSQEQIYDFLSQIKDLILNNSLKEIIIDENRFIFSLCRSVLKKFGRTKEIIEKSPLSEKDLRNNLITGFTGGYYTYFRDVYNDILLRRICKSSQYKAANFYFIREYCYGSMFRYNANGEFNIPYGGISYNKKDFKEKINNLFNDQICEIFKNTDISCADFEDFLNDIHPCEDDFIFLDPPYDTDFSDYEGKPFTSRDHERLAAVLRNMRAKFILVIKRTDFIYNLYNDYFNVVSFDKLYTYNVRSRNNRSSEHLLITNLPV